ncbi:uncharacterized protein si:ch211-81a5.8 [Clupea harengus]|uniref:Uncharacterized protein si:ch211-81a5.8 n=1 Tax=Clupea harengus TaxID=7950 RepID=A0A8M1KVS4_CLUHA|nr:uncharacterized protein si:ch211-81a5.8 [Clupea harengus]
MDSVVKRSLGAPLRHLTSCVTQVKDSHRSRRRSLTGRRKSAPCLSQTTHDSWLRVYQSDLIRERNLRKAEVAQKNAQRSARRAYFNSHQPISKDTQKANFTRSGMRTSARNEDSMFGAFQGLSLNMGSVPTSTVSPPNAEQCKVM